MSIKATDVSIVIPTYRREQILLDTLRHLMRLEPPPSEIIVVDQTRKHHFSTAETLSLLDQDKKIRWVRIPHPSIPHAMNVGLQEARNDIVLFLDDDIIPCDTLIKAHISAQCGSGCKIVAGQVLQPGEEPLLGNGSGNYLFRSNRCQRVDQFMGGNFSIKRKLAIALGGFDENFVHVAYRFETEFADRALAAGEQILFEPVASIRHLKAESGGTRSYGEHLRTIKPSHSVGEYYYLMRARRVRNRLIKMVGRPLRAVRTRHHLRNPWWIPLTLVSELLGFSWAIFLFLRGPRYVSKAEVIPEDD